VVAAASALALPSFAAKPEGQLAPIHRAAEPIKDAQGRIEMIVDFDFDPKEDTEFPHEISPEDARKWDKHQGKFVNLLSQYEKKYGFTRSGMTSWAKFSATAFLDPQQIEKLAKDKRVTLLTENEQVSFSANPPYANTIVGNEFRSWGYPATNGKSGHSPASGRAVYIIDSGVAFHSDLPNVVSRVNVACGSGGNCSTGTSNDPYPVVGCYPHATHVAGIIGARGNGNVANSGGAGVYDGASLHSVAVVQAGGSPSSAGVCSNSAPPNQTVSGQTVAGSTAAIGYALDYVYRSVRGPAPSYINNGVAVVNMSINPGRLGFNSSGQAETNRVALLKTVNPATEWIYEPFFGGWVSVYYPGVFFVQSAGNIVQGSNTQAWNYGTRGKNICAEFSNASNPRPSLAYTHAFPNNNTTSATDGIMVVGAIHHDGVAADNDASVLAPLSGIYDSGPYPLRGPQTDYTNIPSQYSRFLEHSSNLGPCVDVWAPGNLIYSAWGDHTHTNNWLTRLQGSYSANQLNGTSGWVFLSGTSMAAPHVAGAAAYLADTLGLTTPSQIEQAVRNRFKQLYNGAQTRKDRSGTDIKIVELP
jgi:subtilisin family serine protease